MDKVAGSNATCYESKDLDLINSIYFLDLETGLLYNDYKSELSKKPDELELKTFRAESESEHLELINTCSTELYDKEAEFDDNKNELFEYENILGNMMVYKRKIRTFFNAVG